MQRMMILLVVLLLAMTACGGDDVPEQPLPTLVPTRASEEGGEGASPRSEEAVKPGIPPTWTPSSRESSAPAAPAAPVTASEESPASSPAATVDENDERYTVQAGDTLAEIATAFGVELERLADANNIDNIDVIEVGQVLVIPR